MWSIIDTSNDRFRFYCENPECNLSMCNLLQGKLHITTIHNNKRHSYSFSDRDMAFIISQYINSLPSHKRNKILEFLNNF